MCLFVVYVLPLNIDFQNYSLLRYGFKGAVALQDSEKRIVELIYKCFPSLFCPKKQPSSHSYTSDITLFLEYSAVHRVHSTPSNAHFTLHNLFHTTFLSRELLFPKVSAAVQRWFIPAKEKIREVLRIMRAMPPPRRVPSLCGFLGREIRVKPSGTSAVLSSPGSMSVSAKTMMSAFTTSSDAQARLVVEWVPELGPSREPDASPAPLSPGGEAEGVGQELYTVLQTKSRTAIKENGVTGAANFARIPAARSPGNALGVAEIHATTFESKKKAAEQERDGRNRGDKEQELERSGRSGPKETSGETRMATRRIRELSVRARGKKLLLRRLQHPPGGLRNAPQAALEGHHPN
ncbi:hypothetical protein DFH09DRAFT_1068636 [Mycena vulgaris]|nr:hypothetical protein DFH09DRAFT_1068636 [Mycena vulgaris]